jgi:hypothetical protein
MKPLIPILSLFILSVSIKAQSPVLNSYIQEGLNSNKSIQQQNFQLEKSLTALKEATGLFFPSLNLQGNYVDGRGGRSIDFPIGDIINPVYDNLNKINSAFAPGSPKYPTLNNVSEQLNPKNFYNAYFRAALPIVNADIWYNRKIKQDQVSMQAADVAIYKRELVKDIQVAYFNYLKSTAAVSIYEEALNLVNESVRVNQKLVDNGKEVQYAVSRAKSEVSKVQSALEEAKNNQQNAAAYFNFLINKSADTKILIDENLLKNVSSLPSATSSMGKREEMLKLGAARNADVHLLNMSKSSWIPKIGAQVDIGSQATNFKFDNKSRYYLLGVSFDWTLFNGLRDVYKVKQANIELQSIDAQTSYVESSLKLASTTASLTYQSAVVQYRNAQEQEKSASEYFTLMSKRYKEGQALYIEYLDARNELTLASLQKCIAYYDAWIHHAELERANASFNIQP